MEISVRGFQVTSSLDGSAEPSLYFEGSKGMPAPLVVSLHTWSAERSNQVELVAPFVEKRGWNALFPEFRGPNLTTNPRAAQACASRLAMQDVVDAVEQVRQTGRVAEGKIFLVGGSGGGHMALMLAAYRPALWNTVFAACPITDLAAWHGQNKGYAPHIEACCGGPPDTPQRKKEYRSRSPISRLRQLARARVHIAHGKDDPSVPCTQSLVLYHRLMKTAPDCRVFLHIFDGGHELRLPDAFAIFDRALASKEEGKLSG